MVALAAAILSVPAAAGALGNAEEAVAPAPASDRATAGAQPQHTSVDDATADGPASSVDVTRYAGSDAYEQSLEIARALVAAGGGSAEWAVLASGESWTEAAAAGPLAVSLGAPVLLVPPGGLQPPTARPDLVEFLKSAEVRRVVIVGSPEVLPNHEPSVLYGLGMLPRNIERVWSDDPAALSVAVAERMGVPAELGELGHTVIVASDQSPADAVAVGPLAAAGPFPLLLTASDALDARITAYLAEHGIAHAVLAGGDAAIAPTVQEAIEAAGITVTRLAGRDRDDTARLAAQVFRQRTADDPKCIGNSIRIGLAPGQYPVQALAAGPLLAQSCTPLRYSRPDRLPTDLHNTLYLASHRHEAVRVIAFAGEAQLPDGILEPSVPPALLAFPTTWPEDHPRHGQEAVAIVDELGRWRHYPVGSGRGSQQLYDYGGEVFEWSPDGRYLAYVSGPPLFVIDVANDTVAEAEIEAPDLVFSSWHRPVWSPDSTKLAFSAFPGDAPTYVNRGSDDDPYLLPTAEMYMFDTRTGATTRLTHNATSDEPHSWSPDSKSIAFTQAEVDIGYFSIVWYHTSLRVLEYATGTVTEFYSAANAHPSITWSPSGSHIAFTGYSNESDYFEDSQVFVVRRDGSELEELTFKGRSGQIYGWNQDGSRLLYSIGRSLIDFGQPEFYIRDIVTGEDSVLGLKHLATGDLNGWSRTSNNLVHLAPQFSPYEAISHVDVGTGEMVQLLTGCLNADKVGVLDYYPEARDISPDESQFAVIVDDERLVVVSNSSPEGQTIVDFSDEIVLSPYGICRGTWGDNGLRVWCGTGRDF